MQNVCEVRFLAVFPRMMQTTRGDPDRTSVAFAPDAPAYGGRERGSFLSDAGGRFLTQISLSDSVRELQDGAFSSCSDLKQIDLNHVKRLSDDSIHQCEKITSITLPSKIEEIEGDPFRMNPSISAIKVSGGNKCFSSDNGVLYNKDKSVLVLYPQGKTDADFTIPASVTAIGDRAFYDNQFLCNVELPDGLLSVGAYAFSDCNNLRAIRLPDHLQSLGEGAFEFCIKIPEVDIPDSVASIGDYPFRGCIRLRNIRVSDHNPAYTSENGILYDHAKTALIQYPSGKETLQFALPEEVDVIRSGAFAYVGLLTRISFNERVSEIGDGAFMNCISLGSVSVPDTVKTFGASVFSMCTRLTSVTLPKDLGAIPEKTFVQCTALHTVPIPEQVTEIGREAFSGCESLHHIVFPERLTSIGAGAFLNCPGIASVSIPGSVTSMERWSVGYFLNEYDLMDQYGYVCVICTPGSAAESYARTNALEYSAATVDSAAR